MNQPTVAGPQTQTHCPYCALQCGMALRPAPAGTDGADGSVVEVVARDFPTNMGGLCQKGWTAPALLRSPERLTTPLLRTGDGLVAVSWDTALATIVDKVTAIQREHGRDAVAVFGGGGLTNEKCYTLGKFARVALRTKNIDYNGRFCMSSAAAAANRAFGIDRGLPFPLADLAEAEVIMLIGSNAAETMPPFMQWLTRQKANGGRLVVVDPRRTPTARGADVHVQINPGTDLAFVNGLLNLAIANGYVDENYIAARTNGFASVREVIAGYGPERVARITGVAIEQLREVADLIGTRTKVMLLSARGAEQHSKGTDTVSALINLALALGLPGRPGSGYGCLTGQGNGQGGREHGQKADQLPGYRMITDAAARDHVARVWGVGPDSLPGAGLSAAELLDALGRPHGPKALFLLASNPVISAPDTIRVTERMRSLDLLVAFDLVLSESAALADVVLPVTQWAEETGTMTNLEGRVLRRNKALDPPPGVRSELEVLSELATRLGAPGNWPSEPEAIFDELARASAGGNADYSGITYQAIAEHDGVFWPCPAVPSGQPPHLGTPRMFTERFATSDGRANFIAVEHSPVAEERDDEFPLYLTTGRLLAQYQSGAQTRRIKALNDHEPAAFVELHPELAAQFGIADGDQVQLRSRRGHVLAPARITDAIRADTLFMPFHYGQLGTANRLTNPALDPVSKMPEFKVCAVSLTRVDGPTRPVARPHRPKPAIICRCNSVARTDIEARFHAGERTVSEIATSTHATTGCGSCHAEVADVLRGLSHPAPHATTRDQERVMTNPAMQQKVVVVGNGMVGQRFVEALAETDLDRRWHVTVLGEEPRRAYDRVALSSYFGGKSAHDLDLVSDGVYDDPSYVLRLAETVTSIDRVARTVTTSRGTTVGYDRLILATGSSPFVPPVPGHDLPGCFVYRTLEDLEAIKSAVAKARARNAGRSAGMVVGGGLLGLEAAHALRLLGISPHVVELAPRLMPLQVDEGGGQLLKGLIEDLNVRVHTETTATEIRPDRSRLLATLSNSVELDVDVVVFSAGIRPRDELARQFGLQVGEHGGIVVDAQCRTSDHNIFAIGECALVEGKTYGLVGPGYAMARVVADQLLERASEFTGADTSTKLKLMGVDVASFGDALARTEGALEVAVSNPVSGSYAKLVVDDSAQTVIGGVLVGDASRYGVLRTMVGKPLTVDPLALIASVDPADLALPHDAQVCSCLNVTRAEVGNAIRNNELSDVAGIKRCTNAGTGCGSCVSLLKTILVEEGVAVSTALCEHFAMSRAQLFDAVRVTGLRTFTAIIERHGTGRGCDICKPAVASILASLGGGHILDGEQAALQDTNDHFLANMQRNGTYSVVPRIPGGEITPQGLIVIGEIAREYGLYTKITGSQRIDLFGARVEQLPRIWARLVDAGFESGHAYGKALRTVKSCVGSTWCRYGVQDSVSLAIELELRYRGLRSPHKLKSAVSGCARECAEAQSKDFGVIATENGWNLYVGGNGGARPRHADLLLIDADTETLIRTIDRFLMFYIRTADRLQRTSVWVDGLEGGLDYLRSVLLDDVLGICDELDAQMAEHIDNYRDEWAGVLNDPERLQRFVSFVNAPETPDPSISFELERGQIKPARTTIAGGRLEVARI
jgi:nitrite reductase (NADH) large subunit